MANSKKRTLDEVEKEIADRQAELKRIKNTELTDHAAAYNVFGRTGLKNKKCYSFQCPKNLIIFHSKTEDWCVANPGDHRHGWIIPTVDKPRVHPFEFYTEASKFDGGYNKMVEFVEKAEKIISGKTLKLARLTMKLE